LPPQPSVKLD